MYASTRKYLDQPAYNRYRKSLIAVVFGLCVFVGSCGGGGNENETTTVDVTTDPGCRPSANSANNGVDVLIPRIEQNEAPAIDGKIDDVWLEKAQSRDTDCNPLAINNLLADNGADKYQGISPFPFRWAAMHDTERLYILVYGEPVNSASVQSDSTGRIWHDDSVEVFFDGFYSHTSSYDGVDDLQVLVPLLSLGAENSSASSASTVIVGQNSAFEPEFEFANCLCSEGNHLWEFSFRLGSVNIPLNSKFGIEIQINDDVDGGDRESKWGWRHPARNENGPDFDTASTDPSTFGSGFLQ